MNPADKRFRVLLCTAALLIALAAPTWGAETIQLPGGLPTGETLIYDLVYVSQHSTLGSISQPGDLTPAGTTGQFTFEYEDQLVADQLPFTYSIRNFEYRTPAYIAAGIMSGSTQYAGKLDAAGNVLVTELHTRLLELGLHWEHIFDLTVFVPPAHEVAIGDSWSHTLEGPASPTSQVALDTTYTLQSIDRDAGIARIVVEADRVHSDLATEQNGGRTIRREAATFGVLEVALETGRVVSAVAHNRFGITMIPPYSLAFEGKAAIERMEFLSDIRLELLEP